VTGRTSGVSSASDGTSVRAEDRLVVLLHGAFLNPEVWHGYAEALGDGFRVIAPAHAEGAWGLGRRADGAGADEATADVAAEVEAVGGHALVVGHSLGGYIALQLCATRPDLVDGLVLLDASTPPRGFATLLDLHLRALELIPTWISSYVLGRMVSHDDPERWRRIEAAGISIHRGARAVRSIRSLDYWGLVRAIRCPILIVNGSRDWLFRANEASTQAAARQARVVVIHGAGHLMPLNRRLDVAALIRQFAGQLGESELPDASSTSTARSRSAAASGVRSR
jgi:pimeloyl-ACP methyl ester carboxylesterase